jgi:hypothetical protein
LNARPDVLKVELSGFQPPELIFLWHHVVKEEWWKAKTSKLAGCLLDRMV